MFCAAEDTDVVVYTLLPGGMQAGGYSEESRGTCWGKGESDPYAAPSAKGPGKGAGAKVATVRANGAKHEARGGQTHMQATASRARWLLKAVRM